MSIIQDLISRKYIVAKDGQQLGVFGTPEEAKAFWLSCPENPNADVTAVEVVDEALMPTPTPSKPKKKLRKKK